MLAGLLATLLATATVPLVGTQRAQLASISNRMVGAGFDPTHHPVNGSLNDEESTSFSVWLRQGRSYEFRGTCDADCSDLDMELADRSGVVLDRDFASDDVPQVGTQASYTGWYTIRVVMESCSINPCDYSVGTFGR